MKLKEKMDSSNSNFLVGFIVLILATLHVILKRRQSGTGAKKQPPGPPAWPIIGNIFNLGANPHQNLYKLRFRYGPVIWLRLGYINTLIIQSAKAAEELFKKHDSSFCDRKVPQSFTAQNYSKSALALSRYGSYWRFYRRFMTLELMTNKRINETAYLRRKCIDDMMKYIEEDAAAARARGESGELVISHYVFVMSFNLMGNLAFSRDLLNSQSEEGTKFYNAMGNAVDWGGAPNLADFFPFLEGLDPQNVKKNMHRYLGQTIDVLERFVKERIEEKKLMKERKTKDFLDSLLEFEGNTKDEPDSLSTREMLIMILEMFFGGTETTSGTIEWIMAELFREPKAMNRVKEELNRVVGPKRKLEESDIDNLPYLQAVVKEGMRLHPVLPLLLPRNTLEDVNFMGYFIPKYTQVFINAWDIGRDPDAWEDPLAFKPERFLGSDIDYKGQNFELLPFGSGRRICAGIPMAHRILQLTLGTLLHCFDWELGSDCAPQTIDMNERMGITVRKLVPMKAIPEKIIQE